LVIGGAGQVGGALLRALRAADVEASGTYHARPVPGLVPLELADDAAVRALVASVDGDERRRVVFTVIQA